MTWRRAGIVIAAAILVRLVVFALYAPPGGVPEAVDESVAAANLNAGRGYVFEQYGTTYRAFKEPLYIVLLAGWTRVSAAPWALWVFQWSWGAAAAAAAGGLAWALYRDQRRAMTAGLLTAVNPFLVYYDTHIIYPLSCHALLFALVAWTVLDAARSPRWSATAWAGLVMGLTLWQRGVYLAAGLGAWTAAALSSPRGRRRTLARHGLLWLSVALAVIAPWLLRAARVTGRPAMTTESAHIFWMDNTDQPNEVALARGRRWVRVADPAFQQRIDQASEGGQYGLFVDDALRAIAAHPGRFAGRVLQRLGTFIWFSPEPGQMYSAGQKAGYRLSYALLLLAGLLGLSAAWREGSSEARRSLALLAGAAAGVAAAHALFLMNQKYRLPLELCLGVWAAALWPRVCGESPAHG